MTTEQINVENDDIILARLNERFSALTTMTHAASQGVIRSLLVSGAPGVGKSNDVEKVLNNLPERLNAVMVSGKMKATGLYKMLYENRERGNTILIDDCDSVLADEDALNILKSATDTKETRKISWNTETKMETEDGESLPRSFEFHGSVIILTNIDLDAAAKSSNKNAVHIEAMISRSVYLDLGFNSNRAKFLWIRKVIQDGMLSSNGIGYDVEQDVLFYIEANLDKLREISLRTVNKLIAMIRIDQNNWKQLASVTVLK